MSMFQDWLPPNRPRGIRIWLVCHGILNFCWVLPTFSNLSDKYVKNTCDIWLLGKKTRRIRIWLVCHGILNFCWVLPRFSDKIMQNTNDACFLGKKMKRFRIWHVFLRIFNLWGSFLGLVTKIWKMHMIRFLSKKHEK